MSIVAWSKPGCSRFASGKFHEGEPGDVGGDVGGDIRGDVRGALRASSMKLDGSIEGRGETGEAEEEEEDGN